MKNLRVNFKSQDNVMLTLGEAKRFIANSSITLDILKE